MGAAAATGNPPRLLLDFDPQPVALVIAFKSAPAFSALPSSWRRSASAFTCPLVSTRRWARTFPTR